MKYSFKSGFKVAFKARFHISACLYILFGADILTNAADLMTACVGCPCPLDREAFSDLMSDDFLCLCPPQLVRPHEWKINLFYDVEMAGDGFWRWLIAECRSQLCE